MLFFIIFLSSLIAVLIRGIQLYQLGYDGGYYTVFFSLIMIVYFLFNYKTLPRNNAWIFPLAITVASIFGFMQVYSPGFSGIVGSSDDYIYYQVSMLTSELISSGKASVIEIFYPSGELLQYISDMFGLKLSNYGYYRILTFYYLLNKWISTDYVVTAISLNVFIFGLFVVFYYRLSVLLVNSNKKNNLILIGLLFLLLHPTILFATNAIRKDMIIWLLLILFIYSFLQKKYMISGFLLLALSDFRVIYLYIILVAFLIFQVINFDKKKKWLSNHFEWFTGRKIIAFIFITSILFYLLRSWLNENIAVSLLESGNNNFENTKVGLTAYLINNPIGNIIYIFFIPFPSTDIISYNDFLSLYLLIYWILYLFAFLKALWCLFFWRNNCNLISLNFVIILFVISVSILIFLMQVSIERGELYVFEPRYFFSAIIIGILLSINVVSDQLNS